MTKLLNALNNDCIFIDDEEYNLLMSEYNDIIENIEEWALFFPIEPMHLMHRLFYYLIFR